MTGNNLNRVSLLGTVRDNPDIKYTEPSKTPHARFILTTSESFIDRNNTPRTIVTSHKIFAWKDLAFLANQFLRPGSRAFIEGSLQSRSWTADDGSKHHAIEVRASHIIPLDLHAPPPQPFIDPQSTPKQEIPASPPENPQLTPDPPPRP